MFFESGNTVMGEFDGDLRIQGTANIFFRTGAILRGFFEKNVLDGRCVVTLPFGAVYILNFTNGFFDKKNYLLNLKNDEILMFLFSSGEFKLSRLVNSTIKEFLSSKVKLKGVFKHGWLPSSIHEYKSGNFFGSCVLQENVTFHGHIKNGRPKGWGIVLTTNFKESNISCSFLGRQGELTIRWVWRGVQFSDSHYKGHEPRPS